MALLKQSTAYTRMFLMVDSSDHITGKTGLTVTVTLSKAGGAFAAAGGTITEVSSGWYKIALTTTDTNTLGDLAYHCTATGADPTDFSDQVTTFDLSTAIAQTGDSYARLGAPAGASVSADIASVKTSVGAVTGAVGSVTGNVGGNVVGSVASVTGNVGGNVVGSVGSVTGSVGSVVGAVGSVTGNVGGNVTGSVGSIGVGGIASTSFAAGAIDAAAIATDAIGSAEFAASAVSKCADGLLGRNIAGGGSGTRTVTEALYSLRNKVDISAGTMTVYQADDVTSSWTAAVTTTAGNPITQIDPV